jgi:hypothetical protein
MVARRRAWHYAACRCADHRPALVAPRNQLSREVVPCSRPDLGSSPGGFRLSKEIINNPNKCLLILASGRMLNGGMPNKREPNRVRPNSGEKAA